MIRITTTTVPRTSDEVVKCSVEKENIPKNPVDLKTLRSTFEGSASTERKSSKASQGHGINPRLSSSGSFHMVETHPGKKTGSLSNEDETDVVDHSQPSMAEVLSRFRQLERKGQAGKGRKWRSSSAERAQDRSILHDGTNSRYFELEDVDGIDAPSQTTTLIAMFRQLEGKKPSKGGRKISGAERSRSKSRDEHHPLVGGLTPGQIQTGDADKDTPEDGIVQTLLAQWKAIEKPAGKAKRKSWTINQSEPKMNLSTKSPPGGSNKTLVISQNASSGSQKSPKITPLNFQKTQPPQKTTVVSHNTLSKPKVPDGVQEQKRKKSSSEVDGKPFDELHGKTQGRGIAGAHGKDLEEEDMVTFEGIKNLTEKYKQMERQNFSPHDQDSLQRKKQFKWDVKEAKTLGRPQGHFTRTDADLLLTFEKTTLTPPSSPDLEHDSSSRRSDFNKQPDLVEHSTLNSSDWKSEVEELPPQLQIKTLREKYEAMHRLHE